MNKTQQLLKEREELFDKTFPTPTKNQQLIANAELATKILNNFKSFHTTTISLVLNSLKEEVERVITNKIRIGNDGVGKSGSTHNQKRKANNKILKETLSDISTLLSETISNIQTK